MSTFVFNFQGRFASDVQSGKKRQTIRALRKDGRLPVVGDIAKCYTGMRTKRCKLLRVSEVTEVARIDIGFASNWVRFNGVVLNPVGCEVLAIADGFTCADEMIRWFKDQYGPEVFQGFVTVWKP